MLHITRWNGEYLLQFLLSR